VLGLPRAVGRERAARQHADLGVRAGDQEVPAARLVAGLLDLGGVVEQPVDRAEGIATDLVGVIGLLQVKRADDIRK